VLSSFFGDIRLEAMHLVFGKEKCLARAKPTMSQVKFDAKL
jgi:hypothetical protein